MRGGIGAVVIVAGITGLAVSQPPAAPGKKPADPGPPQFQVSDCARCHQSAATPDRAAQAMKSGEFILHNESVTWFEKDIHSAAHANLAGPLGRRMERTLGYPVESAPQCLTCHATDMTPDKADKKPADFDTANGVGCTVCHGAGVNWQDEHKRVPKIGDPLPWREKSPQAKFDRGMTDLRDPAVKARLCASCHVGDPATGKVVTHEMYAAGHPPLPPFELATFMENQPKHWGYPTDPKLKYFQEFAGKKPKETWATFHFHPADQEAYLARQLAAGAVAALEAEAKLLASDAAKGSLDFARFDCAACHHELVLPSPRQERGYDGPPGRVPLKARAGALPGVVAGHAAGLSEWKTLGERFPDKWQALRRAAVARPFGDRAAVKAAAGDLAGWCGEFLAKQSTTATPVYTPNEAARLTDAVEAAAPQWAADPDAAAHLTWAYLALRGDLNRPVAADRRASMDRVLPTRVRAEADPKATRPRPIEPDLPGRQKLFADFDPAAFRAAFAGLK